MTDNLNAVLREFYDELSDKDQYGDYYKTVPFYFKAREFLDQTFNGGFRPYSRLLDVGCGPGHLTSGLPGYVDVVGIDLSPEMLDKARAARPTGRYFEHDFHNPLTEGVAPFDVIFASGALDLANDIGTALAALAASLKDQGLFYFTIPEHRPGTPNNGKKEISARPERQEPVWLHFFPFQEVAESLGKAGLEPVSYQYSAGYRSRTLGIGFDYGYWVAVKKTSTYP